MIVAPPARARARRGAGLFIYLAHLALALGACGGTSAPSASNSDARTTDGSDSAADAATENDVEAGSVDDAVDSSADGVVPRLGPRAPGAVFVHLFEWRWTDVATECEQFLGPAGFAGVQVSPPSEHAVLGGGPWWERYQTVSYSVERSRSGTAAELADMVRRCAAAGVAIYVDAVINHMTAQASGVGSNGSAYTKYSYPPLYAQADFHWPPCAIADSDYQDAPDRVRTCELDGLADLDTSTAHVRGSIADYLTSLVALGVHGFRVDSAKHIAPADLDAILRGVTGAKPYYYFEIVDGGDEAIHPADYLTTGQSAAEAVDAIEFKFGAAVGQSFLDAGGGKPAGLRTLGDTTSGFLPSDRAVVFINNHDTQRGSSIFYQDAPAYDLATVFMLAWPYGYPSILSSYAFDRSTQAGRDQGPPVDAQGNTRPVYAPGATGPDCLADPVATSGGWLCEHRRPFVARLVAFRKATAAATTVTNWWDDGADAIAFGRGESGVGIDLGFVVINNGAASLTHTFATSLAAGAYCDVFAGAPLATGCSGTTVEVAADGTATVTVAPGAAVVLDVGARAAH
jgi:alpha-amylase